MAPDDGVMCIESILRLRGSRIVKKPSHAARRHAGRAEAYNLGNKTLAYDLDGKIFYFDQLALLDFSVLSPNFSDSLRIVWSEVGLTERL